MFFFMEERSWKHLEVNVKLSTRKIYSLIKNSVVGVVHKKGKLIQPKDRSL